MDLWIRSQQNKDVIQSLSKMNDIWICETEEEITIEDKTGPLAIYKTKERVLDEIQNILNPSITPIIGGGEIVQLNTYVYEMPKE